MDDRQCVDFLQWALPRLAMRWPGFRKVRKQVCRRINRRVVELRLADLGAYRAYLENREEEWFILDSLCRVTISRFYRDRVVFDYLADKVLPALIEAAAARDESAIRCLSAGCASGEEPYSLALIHRFNIRQRFPHIMLEIVAIDTDSHLLERAESGCYSASSVKELPPEWLEKAFDRDGKRYCLKDEVRQQVSFQLGDIRSEVPAGPFHLVLCRNLAFTYFDEPMQQRVLKSFEAVLASSGSLVLGIHEELPEMATSLKAWFPRQRIFRKR